MVEGLNIQTGTEQLPVDVVSKNLSVALQGYLIPDFELTPEEETELIGIVKERYSALESYYKEHYETIKRIRFARHCKNYERPIKTKSVNTADDKYAPNLHLPDLKISANTGIAELKSTLFPPNYLEWKCSQQGMEDLETKLQEAYDAFSEKIGLEQTKYQICDNLYYDGTVPVMVKITGRNSCYHDILHEYTIQIDNVSKVNILTKWAESKLGNNNLLYTGDISQLLRETKPVIYITEKYENFEGEGIKFVEIKLDDVVLVNLYEIERGIEKDNTIYETVPQLLQFKDPIVQADYYIQNVLGVSDFTKKSVKPIGMNTLREWVDVLPKVKLLELLDTYIEPNSINDSLDTTNILNKVYRKSQEVYEDETLSKKNRDKLLVFEEGKGYALAGSTSIKMDGGTKDRDPIMPSSLDSCDNILEIITGYFYYLRLKTGKELYNFIVSVAEDKYLLECKPNVSFVKENETKKSKNPFEIFTYYNYSNYAVGFSPAIDMEQCSQFEQKIVNYSLDAVSKNINTTIVHTGLREAFDSGQEMYTVDITDPEYRMAGINNVNQLYTRLGVDTAPVQALLQHMSLIKDQMLQLSNTQAPYMQLKKEQTATEIINLSNTGSVILKSLIMNIGGTLKNLDKQLLDLLIALEVKIQLGAKTYDFSEFVGLEFYPMMTSLTPSLGNEVLAKIMFDMMLALLQTNNPEALSRIPVSEWTELILKKMRLPDTESLVRSDSEAQDWLIKNSIKDQLFARWEQEQKQLAQQQGGNVSG